MHTYHTIKSAVGKEITQPSTRPLCFTYQSFTYHLTHPTYSQCTNCTQPLGAWTCALLSVKCCHPSRSAPLWCPSCLCPCERCWWTPLSASSGSPVVLSVFSVQITWKKEKQKINQTEWEQKWQTRQLSTWWIIALPSVLQLLNICVFCWDWCFLCFLVRQSEQSLCFAI